MKVLEKYTSDPRYRNVPVLVITGTFLVYQYCPILHGLEQASIIFKLTILEQEYGPVISNTRIPESKSIPFPFFLTNRYSKAKKVFDLHSIRSVGCLALEIDADGRFTARSDKRDWPN